MGEAAAVVGIVCGSRGSWLWSRPEANRRQADLDERRRGEFFDVLVQQADEALSAKGAAYAATLRP